MSKSFLDSLFSPVPFQTVTLCQSV